MDAIDCFLLTCRGFCSHNHKTFIQSVGTSRPIRRHGEPSIPVMTPNWVGSVPRTSEKQTPPAETVTMNAFKPLLQVWTNEIDVQGRMTAQSGPLLRWRPLACHCTTNRTSPVGQFICSGVSLNNSKSTVSNVPKRNSTALPTSGHILSGSLVYKPRTPLECVLHL